MAEPVLNIESDEPVEERNVTATIREECECRMRYVTLGVMEVSGRQSGHGRRIFWEQCLSGICQLLYVWNMH